MRRYRFHLLSIAHNKPTKKYCSCAYQQKVYNMAVMMKSLGHEVFIYGSALNDDDGELPPHDEYIEVVDKKTWNDYLGNYDVNENFYKFSEKDPVWGMANRRTKELLPKHLSKERENFVLCFFGGMHYNTVQGINAFVVEPGIGYSGIFAKFKVFESYAWMHWIYGRTKKDCGDWYDMVIPNSYDPDDFPFSAKKDDYFFFLGRTIPNKGIGLTVEIARKLGKKLYIAGQVPDNLKDLGITLDDQIQYVGTVDVKSRGEWLSKAEAVFIPTFYIEPFGGVNVEAQLCGTPVITSSFGVFNETIKHGTTGYRCSTFKEFLWAAEHAKELNPHEIRKWAIDNFSIHRVKHMYQRYWDQIADLTHKGWYETEYNPVENLDHFNKYYG